MICQQTTDWIWETVHPEESPPSSMATHLEDCEVCKGERAARKTVSVRMRNLRKDEGSDPSPGLDQMVLDAAAAAAAARESGDYGTLRPEVHDEFAEGLGASLTGEMRAMMSGDFATLQSFEDISDEIAESIAEEYGAEIAALTTGRLQVADGPPPASLPQSPRAAPKSPEYGEKPSPSFGPTPRRALLVAALVVGAASSGFLAGRLTAPRTSNTSYPLSPTEGTSAVEVSYALDKGDQLKKPVQASVESPEEVDREGSGDRPQTRHVDSSAESRPGR